ncbi:hypothetical protein PLICRDRAFT_137980 [Plicaturopsis crispa FD-325 SS-3]|nr:hypothetical protein PLICRDRAFT_137980 [Plicaturopsis crispa FD-325 SS-3]
MSVPEIAAEIVDGIPPTFQWPVKFCAGMTAATYILSILTGNVSQVDRVWTFLPYIYTAYFALLPLWPSKAPLPLFPYTPDDVSVSTIKDFSPRALVMLGLVTLWMLRLSYNTYRRGLFNLGDEDYRWAVLRKEIPPWLFQITNLVFIAGIQNVILFLLGIPTQIAALQPHTALAQSDYILGALALLTLAIEFTADNQQYSYQTWKHSGGTHDVSKEWPFARTRWTQEDKARGFLTKGLWGWSRHPNFLCEQTFWIIITLFPLAAPDAPRLPVHSTNSFTSLAALAPALVLCLLFFSSTLFTEKISLAKYPVAYRAYRQRVSMFFPLTTPVWGFLLKLQGRKKEIDSVVYGAGLVTVKKNV